MGIVLHLREDSPASPDDSDSSPMQLKSPDKYSDKQDDIVTDNDNMEWDCISESETIIFKELEVQKMDQEVIITILASINFFYHVISLFLLLKGSES